MLQGILNFFSSDFIWVKMVKNEQKIRTKNFCKIYKKFLKKILTSACKYGIQKMKINIYFQLKFEIRN